MITLGKYLQNRYYTFCSINIPKFLSFHTVTLNSLWFLAHVILSFDWHYKFTVGVVPILLTTGMMMALNYFIWQYLTFSASPVLVFKICKILLGAYLYVVTLNLSVLNWFKSIEKCIQQEALDKTKVDREKEADKLNQAIYNHPNIKAGLECIPFWKNQQIMIDLGKYLQNRYYTFCSINIPKFLSFHTVTLNSLWFLAHVILSFDWHYKFTVGVVPILLTTGMMMALNYFIWQYLTFSASPVLVFKICKILLGAYLYVVTLNLSVLNSFKSIEKCIQEALDKTKVDREKASKTINQVLQAMDKAEREAMEKPESVEKEG